MIWASTLRERMPIPWCRYSWRLVRGSWRRSGRFAEVYPDDCILLVDTIDTLESGIPNAIIVFEELRAAGHKPVGIRLDSGDLAYLSMEAVDDA